MSKLCPDCMNQVDDSVSNVTTCKRCQIIILDVPEEQWGEWDVREAPEQWSGDE